MNDSFQALDGFAFLSKLAGERHHALLKVAIFRAKCLDCLGDVAALSDFCAELVLEVCVPVCE
jgi:hypothetical protein